MNLIGHLRRLFKHSVLYGLSETISRGTGFVLIYIYTHGLLTANEIGIRTLLYAASAFIGLLYTFGLDNSFLRYFMDEDYKSRKKTILSTSLFFTVLTGLIFFSFSMIFGNFLSTQITASGSYSYLTNLVFLILILDTVVIYPMLILRAENRFVYYTLISFTRFVLFILLNFLLIKYMGRGVNGVFEANIIVVLIVFILLFPVIKENIVKSVSFSLLKKMLYFGIPTIFTIFAMRILDFSDRRIIVHFFDNKSVGEYSVAYSLGMVGIMVFVNSFRTAWQPFFLELKKKPEAKDVFAKVATYYAVFIGLVYLGMVLFREEIFRFYASESYDISLANIVPFVALAYVIFGFYIIMLPGVFFKDKTVFLPVASLTGAFINIVLNIILVPKLGIMGAAYTTVIGYFIMLAILYNLSCRIYKIRYELGRIFLAAVFTGFPVLLYEIYQPEGMLLEFAYRLILLIIPPVLYLSTGFLHPAEKKYLTGLVKKLLKIK